MTRSVEYELRANRDMPYGAARIAASEATTRRIEREGPRERLAEALLDLVEAYSFADQGDKSFVTFARALRLWDDNPELFDAGDQRNLFWEFKWVAGDLSEYPQITSTQAEAFLADMERRFEIAGHGLSSVRMSWFRWAWHAGRADAEAARVAWVTGLRDEYEDCRACTIGQQVDFFVDTERYAEAVALGRTQDSSCNIEPTRTNYALALAALMTGDTELALAAHKRALAGDDGETTDSPAGRGQAFAMLGRGGRIDQALRILRSDYPGALRTGPSPALHLRFLLGVLAGLAANLDQGELETGFAEPEWRTIADLYQWVGTAAARLAGPLDARNGSDMHGSQLARAMDATRVVQQLPAPPKLAPTGLAGITTSDPEPRSDPAPRASEAGTMAVVPVGSDPVDTESAGAEPAGTEPADFEPAGTEPTGAEPTGAELLALAEHLAARRAGAAAVRSYLAAAEQLEREGWLEQSGLAYAEAAQATALDHEDAEAHALFSAAVQRLRAGHADPDVVVAVLTAWAPIAARMSDPAEHLGLTRDELASYDEFTAEGLSEELAARRHSEWLLRRAHLRDTLARAIASAAAAQLPDGFDTARAVAEALEAGTEYAQLGHIADAAHAFWLAGRIQRDTSATVEAIWALESAFEGFTVARVSEERVAVASELIVLLRAAGLPEQADAIVEQLAQ
ncbi:hypothetical protein [Leucobacter luti]|uniref:hypothetical protein n=1 Tax=Leucobacter luti TaxID=340320 RepID=UPI001C68BE48|nr:hypothetical protein [Leucobacter luti]QYM76419.1 hypothetical protein K1X41_02885 [Leucobacter luti]